MKFLGLDIGGTKTAVCVGTEEGRILSSLRMDTRTGGSMADYFARMSDLCRQVMRTTGLQPANLDAVGISAPGPLNVKTGILYAPPNNPGWRNVPIVKVVREMFNRPVFMNNDANAAALAEYLFGEYRGTRNLLYLTFSTGMGGGIIAEGRLLQGVTDTGGEVGHHCIDVNGPPCACGRRGCFEAYVGGRTVADRLREKIRAGGVSTGILDRAGGDIEKIDHRAFAAAARDGDPFAVAEWEEFTERLAQGIGNLIMILNPEVVILGTIAIHEGEFVMKPLRERLRKYVWEWPLAACKVAPSALGGDIGNLAAIAVATAGVTPSRLDEADKGRK